MAPARRAPIVLLAAALVVVVVGTLAATVPGQSAVAAAGAATVKATVTATVKADAVADVALTPFAEAPGITALAVRPGDPALYATTKPGLVVALREGRPPVTVLDLTDRVHDLGEGGLLGLAFSPDGTRLFLSRAAAPEGDVVLTEHVVGPPPGIATGAGTGRELLRQPHPAINHFGGPLRFAPDGTLWLGLGDGGGDEADAGPNAQDRRSWLGKLLRMTPDPSASAPYTVPADNPFAHGGGRPEVAVLGLRNPWSFTFDPTTGDLWVADVGQDTREEVTRVAATKILGANLGWNVFEGSIRFVPRNSPGRARRATRAGRANGSTTPTTTLPRVPDALGPLVELAHDDGYCAVVGGVVVRDGTVPALRDRYVFGDHCTGTLFTVPADTTRTHVRARPLGPTLAHVTAFTVGPDGALYAASLDGGVVRLTAA